MNQCVVFMEIETSYVRMLSRGIAYNIITFPGKIVHKKRIQIKIRIKSYLIANNTGSRRAIMMNNETVGKMTPAIYS